MLHVGGNLEITVLQGGKSTWEGFTQRINLMGYIPVVPGAYMGGGGSLIFKPECSRDENSGKMVENKESMGNLIGLSVKIGISVAGEPPVTEISSECTYVKVQSIFENIKDHNGQYTGKIGWTDTKRNCEFKYKGSEKGIAQCKQKIEEEENPKCPNTLLEQYNWLKGHLDSTKCKLEAVVDKWENQAKACAAIYGCQAGKCAEGFTDFSKEAYEDCDTDIKKACGTFADEDDCKHIRCSGSEIAGFYDGSSSQKFARAGGSIVKCIERGFEEVAEFFEASYEWMANLADDVINVINDTMESIWEQIAAAVEAAAEAVAEAAEAVADFFTGLFGKRKRRLAEEIDFTQDGLSLI